MGIVRSIRQCGMNSLSSGGFKCACESPVLFSWSASHRPCVRRMWSSSAAFHICALPGRAMSTPGLTECRPFGEYQVMGCGGRLQQPLWRQRQQLHARGQRRARNHVPVRSAVFLPARATCHSFRSRPVWRRAGCESWDRTVGTGRCVPGASVQRVLDNTGDSLYDGTGWWARRQGPQPPMDSTHPGRLHPTKLQ